MHNRNLNFRAIRILMMLLLIVMLCANATFAKSYKQITGTIQSISKSGADGYMTILIGPSSEDTINLFYATKMVPNASTLKEGDKVTIKYAPSKGDEGDISGEITKIDTKKK
jgi:hypothetical protein